MVKKQFQEKNLKKFISIFLTGIFLIFVCGVFVNAAAPNVSLNNPADGETNVSTNSVLNVTATDEDGDDMNVSFYGNEKVIGKNWTMFQANLQNTGYTTNTGPDDISVKQNNFTTGGVVDSSPAVANGYVYIGSNDNNIYQLNATDLSLVNNYTTGDSIWESSPAVANGYVYIGSNDNNIYQLNATDLSLVNSYETGGSIYSSPAVANGYVYVGSDDHNVYQLNGTTMEQVNNFTTENYVESSPAVANGYVYIGSYDHNVYQLNATDLSLVNNYTTGDRVIKSPPTVANGYVYVGSHDNNIYQLNATDLSLVNNYTTGDYVYSPAVAKGYVYVGSADHNVYQLDATDLSLVNTYTTGDYVVSSPAVANGYVYIGSYDHNVYQLNATDLSLVNSYSTGNDVRSSPAVANGYVYVGSVDNNVYQLGGGEEIELLNVSNNISNNSSVTYQWSDLVEGTIYEWYVNVTDGTNTATFETWNFTTGDFTPPTYSNPSYNSSLIEKPTEFSLTVEDNVALQPKGEYIFSTNNSGEWVNDTAVNFTSTPETVSSTKVLNSNTSLTIGYKWYIKDNEGNKNNTEIYTLKTNKAPNQPTLNFPTDGETNVTDYPLITNITVSDPDGDLMNVSFFNTTGSTDELIGTITGVTNNSDVTTEWVGLSENTTYEWYANITDGEGLTTSQTWNFTTGIFPLQILVSSPENKEYATNEIWFNASSSKDVDTWIVNYNGTNITGINFARTLQEGDYDLKVWANDSEGNVVLDESVSFSVNTPKIDINTIYPTKDVNVSKNEFFEVIFNVSCSENNCGNIDVTLDPIEGCDPAAEVCTDACDDLFVNDTSGWHYDSDNMACIDDTERFGVGADSMCDKAAEEDGGDCAIFGELYCPSYVRNGNTSVQGEDCKPNDPELIETYYDLENEYFTGSSGSTTPTKGGIVSTDSSATPFYTNKSSNPYTINLNQSQSKEVTFLVNASGEINTSYSYEFFGYANLSSIPSISSSTEKWNVTIVENGTTSDTEDTTEDTEDSSSGGGGGGGGGGGATEPTRLNCSEDEIKTSEGCEGKLYDSWELEFSSNDKEYVLKLNDINSENNTVNLTFLDEPITFELKENETKEFDLDGDGINDLNVSLEKVSFSDAVINLKSIEKEEVSDSEEKINESASEETGETEEPEEVTEGFNYVLWIIIVIVILIILGLLFWYFKKKREENSA